MSALLILVIVFLYSCQPLFCKMFTDRYPGNANLSSSVFCILESIAIPLFTWAWCGFRFEILPVTFLIGLCNTIAIIGYNVSLIQAGKLGSYAFLNVMMLFGGITIPLIYSLVVLGETLSVLQIVAILLMFVVLVLMNAEEIQFKGTPPAYYIYCVLLFLFNGMYGTLLKVQSVYNDAQSKEMIIVTFGMMGVVMTIWLGMKEKKNTLAAFRLSKVSILPLLLCLLCASLAINMLVLVIPLVNVSVLYTVENGGVLLLSAIFSMLFFKEKLSPLKIGGILLAVVSITMLSI